MPTFAAVVVQLKNYLSLVKFSHTIFAMPFALIGFVLALTQNNIPFDRMLALKVLLCMIFARTSAMAFNRWADQDIDAKNPRTKVREIPAGIISSRSALLFTTINCLAFILTTWFINRLCFALSFVALAVVLGYSYSKRFTILCHLILGLGLSLAPVGAWIAVTGSFALIPVLFSLAVLCWVGGFDIIYALQDEQFDKSQKLHSIPEYFGGKKSLLISRNLHIASSLFILSAGLEAHLGTFYFSGWLLFSLLLIYQHRLVKPNDYSKINVAFFTTNGLASILFSAFVLLDLFVT